MSVRADAKALVMEEQGKGVMSLQSMLAPEEIYNNVNSQKDNNNATRINSKESRGSMIAETELNKGDRKRVRRMKKRKHSNSAKAINDERRNESLAYAMTNGHSDRNPNIVASDYQ